MTADEQKALLDAIDIAINQRMERREERIRSEVQELVSPHGNNFTLPAQVIRLPAPAVTVQAAEAPVVNVASPVVNLDVSELAAVVAELGKQQQAMAKVMRDGFAMLAEALAQRPKRTATIKHSDGGTSTITLNQDAGDDVEDIADEDGDDIEAMTRRY